MRSAIWTLLFSSGLVVAALLVPILGAFGLAILKWLSGV